MNRHNEVKREVDPPAELESQFILQLPPVSNSTLSNNERMLIVVDIYYESLIGTAIILSLSILEALK